MLVGSSSNPATLFMSNAPHSKSLTGLLAPSFLFVGSAASGCNDSAAGGSLRIAYVTNGVDPFWDVAAAGARAAEKEFGVNVEIIFPAPATVEVQRQKVQDLLVRGIDACAINSFCWQIEHTQVAGRFECVFDRFNYGRRVTIA